MAFSLHKELKLVTIEGVEKFCGSSNAVFDFRSRRRDFYLQVSTILKIEKLASFSTEIVYVELFSIFFFFFGHNFNPDYGNSVFRSHLYYSNFFHDKDACLHTSATTNRKT